MPYRKKINSFRNIALFKSRIWLWKEALDYKPDPRRLQSVEIVSYLQLTMSFNKLIE